MAAILKIEVIELILNKHYVTWSPRLPTDLEPRLAVFTVLLERSSLWPLPEPVVACTHNVKTTPYSLGLFIVSGSLEFPGEQRRATKHNGHGIYAKSDK